MTYQQITVVGNVGGDAELHRTKDNIAICSFSVAVNKISGKGETRREKTTWFTANIWRERAEGAVTIIKKGAKILVTGEVDLSTYIDPKDGTPRGTLEITVSTFQLLSPRGESDD